MEHIPVEQTNSGLMELTINFKLSSHIKRKEENIINPRVSASIFEGGSGGKRKPHTNT